MDYSQKAREARPLKNWVKRLLVDTRDSLAVSADVRAGLGSGGKVRT